MRKGVLAAGHLVEQVINRAEKLGGNLKGGSLSTQPVLSLEGQISIPKLKELLNSTAEKVIVPAIPGLVDKTALEIREGQSVFAKFFKEKGASVATHVDMAGSAGAYAKGGSGINSLRSASTRLPFEDGFFDYVAALYSNQYQGDIVKAVKEFARVLSIAGDGIIVDFHPFGMYAKRGSLRLKPTESTIRGVEDYYRLCKSAGLRITSIRESFLDEELRPMFETEGEKAAFRMVKDTPLLIYLFVKKGA